MPGVHVLEVHDGLGVGGSPPGGCPGEELTEV